MESDLFPQIPSKKPRPVIPRRIVRIALGATASAALDETGLPAFGIVGCERPPGQPRRWVIYLAELRHPAAMEAIQLLNTTADKESSKNPSDD